MIDKKIIHLFRTLALLILAGVLCCCTDDRESFERPGGAKQKEVTFSVEMPPATYALNSTQEDQVETIEVLLFSGGNYTGSPIYRGSADITTTPGNSRIKTFTVKIPEGTYDVVVLANSRPAINAVHAAIDADPNKSKSYVLSKIVQSVSGKWNATPGSGGYVSIPMWGEITGLTVNSAVPAQTINLTRMLAKIDVSLAAAAQPKFKLRSVHLYNYYNRGYVIPQTANWTTTPSPVTASRTLGPLNYTTMTTPDKACAGEIYTFEAPSGSSANHLTNSCIVVGGLYNGSSALTYYRIDFNQTGSGTVTYRPLLRNHSYTVSIADVEGAGLGTPDEAFKSRAVKIQADILAWNDGAMSDVVSDGQHKLGVSQGAFTFTREARTASSPDNVLSITTDVSSGWKVLKIIDGSNTDVNIDTNPSTGWIRLSPNNKNNAGSTNTDILLKENTSGASRTAKIHINAGRLTYVVTVTQNTAAALMLTLRDAATNTMDVTDLVFASAAGVTPAQQSVKLSWMPVDKAVDVERFQVGSNPWFAYSGGDQLGSSLTSITDPSGAKTLNIQPGAFTPPANDPFQERISKIDFTVFNGTNYLSKSLFLRQMVYNFLVEETTGYYRLDGSTYTLRVKSNTGWKISSISENVTTGSGSLLNLAASDNLRTTTSGGTTPGSGLDIKFRVTTNASLRGTLTVKFASTDSPVRFAEKTLVMSVGEAYPAPHTGWAGSNIYWDSALNRLTFDDMGSTARENYQGVFFQWGSLWGIAPNGSQASAWSTSNTVYRTSGGAYTSSTGYGWTSIPRIPDATNVISYPPSGKSERDRAYLYELSDEANGRGDICKFLTKMGYAPGSPATKWRMPTSNEFEGTYGVSGSWSNQTSNSPSGMYDNPGRPGYTKAAIPVGAYPPAFFPTSGNRYSLDGLLNHVGTNGFYWSSSPNNNLGSSLYFYNRDVGPNNAHHRGYCFSVRCVKE